MIVQINKTKSLLETIFISLISIFVITMGLIVIVFIINLKEFHLYYIPVIVVGGLVIFDALIELLGVVICLIYDWSTIIEINSNTDSVKYHNIWIGENSFSYNEIEYRIEYYTPIMYRYGFINYAFIQLKDGKSILLGMYIENAEQKELFRLDGGSPYETKSSLVYKELFAHILKLWRSSKRRNC